MNQMLWPTLLIAVLLFWIGMQMEQKIIVSPSRILFIFAAIALAIPGILFAGYYTKLLGEPIWFYEFRTVPNTELAAAAVGLLAGFIHQARHKHPQMKRQLSAVTIPAIVAVVLAIPYLKPIIRPLDKSQLHEHLEEGVCIQSAASTCGPASAATLVRALGKNATEAELAQESLTSASGTENWYLARALNKRGFQTKFKRIAPDFPHFPTPAIAGVKLDQGAGHFIALLGYDGTNYIASDPLTGRFVTTLSQLKSDYHFTGFFLVIK